MPLGTLLKSSVLDPATILQGGVGADSRLVLIEKRALSGYTANGVDVITALALLSGETAYSIEGIRQSLKPKYERVAAPSGQSVYKHTAEFFYFEYDQLSKNNLQRLAQGRYVAIFENAKQDANTFEVCGLNVGMECTEMIRAVQENGGAVKVTLASPENEFEAKLPQTFFMTDYSATRALIDGYLSLPTITTIAPLAAAAAGGTALTITGTGYFGGGTNNGVLKLEWINNSTGAVVTQTTYTVASNTSITFNTVAMAAGSYKLKITTIKGAITSVSNLIVT
jgi:hypothetical protein